MCSPLINFNGAFVIAAGSRLLALASPTTSAATTATKLK